MTTLKPICSWMIFSFLILAGAYAQAEVVTYSLNNVILDDNYAQMSGEFSWTYDVGDFENGVGQFTYLDIPFTAHDHTDLNTTIDIGSSIEITLEGSVHDDGVDITLVLLQPLTPTSGSSINLAQSHFDIGGNGFHAGLFLSGNVLPSLFSSAQEQPTSPSPSNTLTAYPNPFNPQTRLVFELAQESVVRLELFDLRGRSIGLLSEGLLPSGMHTVRWDGTDRYGQSVPSGRYFAKLHTDSEVFTQALMLVR